MSVARLSLVVEGFTGSVPTAEQLQRLGANYLPLVVRPGETLAEVQALSANQRALRIVRYLREHCIGLLDAGTEALFDAATPEQRRAAVLAARQDLP